MSELFGSLLKSVYICIVIYDMMIQNKTERQ